jgi:hypothetical protein
VFVHGATGRFKTALAVLIQQHFGVEFAAHRLSGRPVQLPGFTPKWATPDCQNQHCFSKLI